MGKAKDKAPVKLNEIDYSSLSETALVPGTCECTCDKGLARAVQKQNL
jgi:hypothetical protein